jgi:predicted dehydrogenase
MVQRVKVGIVGAGVIAQVMHLNYLRELSDRFEIAALCDIALANAEANADSYGIPKVFSDWREMLKEPIDAVLILTSGSHALIAVEAAKAGKHVLVEKPMCFSVAEGKEMRDAADAAGVVLMVAYPKRYDPAFDRFREEVAAIESPRLMRVTTLEAPLVPYIGHYALAPIAPVPAEAVEAWKAATEASITRAIGEATPFLRKTYHMVLLDTLVHEINTVRGVLGEPERLDYVDCRDDSLTAMLTFGGMPVAIHWIDLPGIARYSMEFACYGPDRRVTLSFPSPFLRSAPTMLDIEGGEPNTSRSWRIEETTSYDSAFKRELAAFHECITTGTAPMTDATDAIHDLALCEAIIRCYQTKAPIESPTAIA